MTTKTNTQVKHTEEQSIIIKTITTALSLKIMSMVSGGMDIKDAWNKVFPDYPYEKLASELYESLNNRADGKLHE